MGGRMTHDVGWPVGQAACVFAVSGTSPAVRPCSDRRPKLTYEA